MNLQFIWEQQRFVQINSYYLTHIGGWNQTFPEGICAYVTVSSLTEIRTPLSDFLFRVPFSGGAVTSNWRWREEMIHFYIFSNAANARGTLELLPIVVYQLIHAN